MMNLHDANETFTTPSLQASARRLSAWSRACSAALALSLGALLHCGAAAQAPAEAPAAPEPQRYAWPSPPPEPSSEVVVHGEFQTSAHAVKPKGKFLLALRFDIPKGYRISWQNPGDVGKTTRVVFEVPEGFSVGPVLYPAPRRFELPGDLINYGYENQTAIFAEVTAPDRVPDGQVFRFDVKADWLACENECATEELSAWIELASSAFAAEPELPSELAPYYAAVPTAFADLPDSNVNWKRGSQHPALTLKAREVKWVDFFPGDIEQPKLLAMKPARNELRLEFASASSSQPLRGLAVGEVEGKTGFYEVNLPWPSE